MALPKNGCRWASGWWFVLTSGSTDGPGHFHRSKVDLPLGCWHFDLLDEWHAPSCHFAIFCQHLPIHQFTNWAKQGASAFRRGPTAGFSLPGSTDVSKHLRIRSTPLGPAMWWMSWWVRPGRPSPRWRDDLFPQLLSSLYRSSGDKENPNQWRVIWVIWRSSQRWIFGLVLLWWHRTCPCPALDKWRVSQPGAQSEHHLEVTSHRAARNMSFQAPRSAIGLFNGHSRNLNWRYLPYIRPM